MPTTIVGNANLAALDTTDTDSITIELPSAGVEFPHFLNYSYQQSFLVPADGWSFDLDQDELTSDEKALLIPGQTITVKVRGLAQSTGVIDAAPVRSGKGGTVIHVEGRDWFAPCVDAQIDPRTKFTPSQTLLDVVNGVFNPFGVTAVLDDNTQNVSQQTGEIYGTKASLKGKLLKSVLAHQLKPYPREGAFTFASRVAQRFGCWIWASSTPGTVIVGQPDFTTDPLYTFQHSTSDTTDNNIEEGEAGPSRKNQPSVIFASGVGGGGEFANSAIRCAILNPYIEVDTDALIASWPGIQVITLAADTTGLGVHKDTYARPLYLYDPESHTQEEIVAYARREMSLRMRESYGCHYTTLGHSLGGTPIAMNTMANVNDDRSNLHSPMWILSRHFTKSASDGTRTKTELILPGSLQF